MNKRIKGAADPDIVEFEQALFRSLDHAMRGEGRVNTAEQIAARRQTRLNDAMRDRLARQSKTNR